VICVSYGDVCVDVASRVSARRPPHFLLLRQEKVSKEKATRVGEGTSPRFALGIGERDTLGCGTAIATKPASTPPIAPTRPSGSPPLSLRWCDAPAAAPAPHPCVCAEQRSGARIKRDACLSPQGEFAARPRFASSAGCPGAVHRGRRHQGRLLFAYFLLAKQEKVRRLPGRNPACNESNNPTPQKKEIPK
jgi:hypothetical protein